MRYITILPDSTVKPGLLVEDDENLFIDLDRKAVSITSPCTDYYTDRGIRWVTMCEGSGGDYILDVSDNVWYNTDYIDPDFEEDQCELIDRDEALFCIDAKRLEFYNPKTKTWDKIK